MNQSQTRKWRFHRLTVALAGLGAMAIAWHVDAAPQLQDHQSIRNAVRQFLAAQLKQRKADVRSISVGALDPRLRLPRCNKPLEAFATGARRLIGSTTVGVRCHGAKPWKLYVSAQTVVVGNVVVTTLPLARHHVLKASDLRVARRDLTTLPRGYLEQPQQAVGEVLLRQLGAGQVVRLTEIAAPKLVRRGETVTLTADAAGVLVRMSGKALSDGASGDTVQVRNLSSRRVVQGVVTAPGVVSVE
ncbi:MAG: flagellar basal body P-ring formation chaperone FlgA [Gammaproteobacteria bacterium]